MLKAHARFKEGPHIVRIRCGGALEESKIVGYELHPLGRRLRKLRLPKTGIHQHLWTEAQFPLIVIEEVNRKRIQLLRRMRVSDIANAVNLSVAANQGEALRSHLQDLSRPPRFTQRNGRPKPHGVFEAGAVRFCQNEASQSFASLIEERGQNVQSLKEIRCRVTKGPGQEIRDAKEPFCCLPGNIRSRTHVKCQISTRIGKQ